MSSEALDHLVVVDRSESIGGQFCARLMADYGARVLLEEPAAGSALRRSGPFAADGSSLTFHHLNTGKESVVEAGPALHATADVIVLAADDDAEAFAALHPSAVIVALSDFGADGPLADWQAGEIVHQALSGMMYNNGAAGREPLYGVGQRTAMAAGLAAYGGAMVALLARGTDASGQIVRIDVQETAAATCFPYVLQHIYNGTVRSRSEPSSLAGQARCRDGWVCMWIYAHRWKAVLNALDLQYLDDDPRFSDPTERRRNWDALFAEIQESLQSRDAADVVDRLQRAQVIAAKAVKPSELGTDPHLDERAFWTEAGGRRILGAPWRLTETPRRVIGPEPAPGVHDPLPAPANARHRTPAARPLDGLRVTELTTAWAGPMAGRVLASFGAETYHVEGPGRVNTWRLHHEPVANPANFPDGVPGDRPFDRAFLFNSQNANKGSLVVDIKAPDGLEILRGLARVSDVLICNFRPGTLRRFGLDHATLSRDNPGLIVCEMPAFGCEGPMAGYAALGPIMEMATGMSALIGYPDGPPENTGPSYMDPIGGFNAAAAILTALVWRTRTGRGQYIEVPQVEAAMQLIGPEILAALETGQDPPRQGNRRPDASPHDAFPARGEEAWLAIACRTDREWQSLCTAIGRPELARDPRFATFTARKADEDALATEIAAWSRDRDKHEAAALLQAAGVPAAPVNSPADLATSAYLAARGHFTELDHPEAGRHRYPGLPMHLSASPGGARRAAPTFGQSNAHVVREILGWADADLGRLAREAGLCDVPAPR